MLTVLDAIAGALHADPFSVLGPHVERGRLIIRVCLPRAEAVSVLRDGRPPLAMTKSHPAGVYEVAIPDASDTSLDYRLRVTYPGNYEAEIDDAYRFGRVITDYDLYLFGEGSHTRIHDKLGAHPLTVGSTEGVHFAVWAPNATRVSVVGDFNDWDGRVHPMRNLGASGVWEIFVPTARLGHRYKFEVRTRTGEIVIKTDPFGFEFEVPPLSASIVSSPAHEWRDHDWMDRRADAGSWFEKPMAIYEVHLGSWARVAIESTDGTVEGSRYLTYRELSERLIPYVKEMGYTHIELLPVMEHPYSASWGYQVTGFFAPTSRFGTPSDFKAFVDVCHQHDIGVILDWVPGHFPKDAHGLARFDGTALFEHADPRQGEHRDWGTLIFNYGRNEVRSFLLANALFWLQEYHADGLRVDAVASMLYLDYSRNHGEWIPNRFGGRENLEAIDFIRHLNTQTHADAPGSITIAEESTAWPSVSRPTWIGGLGFTYKWNMGWMNDILQYVRTDPVYRKWDHRHLTFSMLYAFNENFILPFSHDEVVHGKGSMFGKIPGDDWQKAATLRALYGFMYTHPGKKLMFMGDEFGQGREWNHDESLDWALAETPLHAGLKRYVSDLNRIYASEPSLYEVDFDFSGFQWIDCNDSENSVVSLIRRGKRRDDFLVAVLNFTPVPREGYRIGVPDAAAYTELVNSDAGFYGGGNIGNGGTVPVEAVPDHGYARSVSLRLPPLGFLLLKPVRG